MRSDLVLAAVLAAGWLGGAAASGETVPVLHEEGVVRGFLTLRSLDGALLANGELIQTSAGGRVRSRLVLRFKDGSVQDETSVFTQRGRFRLESDHVVQRGPSFPHPLEVRVEVPADPKQSRVRIKYREDDGTEKSLDERMELPDDVANGLPLTLLKNISPGAPSTTVSMVAATPKPRLVKLVVTRAGEDAFTVGSASLKATRFNVKIEIGGLAGLIAPLIGKQPHDTSVWVVEGEAPGFVRSEGPLFQGGPIWRLDLAAPVWPKPPPKP